MNMAKLPLNAPLFQGQDPLLKALESIGMYINKPAAQAAGADPSRCNSTNRQNPQSPNLTYSEGIGSPAAAILLLKVV